MLHHNDGGVRVSVSGVGLEVFLYSGGCGLLLFLVGMFPYPEEDLWRVVPQSLVRDEQHGHSSCPQALPWLRKTCHYAANDLKQGLFGP